MEIHSYNFNSTKPKLKDRLLRALLLAVCFFMLMFSWKFFWPDQFEASQSYSLRALEVAVVALVFGIGNAITPKLGLQSARTSLPPYKVLVDDESITGYLDYGGSMKWVARKRTVRKGHVRSIIEIKGRSGSPGSIRISERSGLSARMFGYVFISKALPEFEKLKSLAESWRAPNL